MRSKAAIGNHPIHPALVPIPIGAFCLALIGDIAFTANPQAAFWYRLSFTCIGVGVLFALAAAVPGAVDYFAVKMPARAFRVATRHGVLNLLVVALYAVSFLLRRHDAAMASSRWPAAAALAFAGFALVAVTGWLGGQLAFEHRVGVVEGLGRIPGSRADERAAP